jgi:hypothetical protein
MNENLNEMDIDQSTIDWSYVELTCDGAVGELHMPAGHPLARLLRDGMVLEDLKSDAFYFVNNVAPWQDLVCANLWRLTEHYSTDCHFFLNDLIDPNE